MCELCDERHPEPEQDFMTCNCTGCQPLPEGTLSVPPPTVERISWDEYFFSIARSVATRGTCPRARIGAVLVNSETHRILGTGYNGAVAGDPHCDDVGCVIFANHCVNAVHAEENCVRGISDEWGEIIGQDLSASSGWDVGPSIMYIVGPREVCSHCAKLMAEVGVGEVRWKPE